MRESGGRGDESGVTVLLGILPYEALRRPDLKLSRPVLPANKAMFIA
jgi:hypothetical protein